MIGILGGTFDPIHHGHLRLALELYERLQLQHVHLLPSANPPHRDQPTATAEQRLRMVELAVDGEPALHADDRELRRSGPSYMLDTLSEFRAEFGAAPLCLLLGMDAFLSLHTWHEWQRLTDFAHLVVVRRPNTVQPMEKLIETFLNRHRAWEKQALHDAPCGAILQLEIPALTISATQIRTLLQDNANPRYLLPEAVLQFILTHQLYQESNNSYASRTIT
jgi:nicotinate-nucleotide adenylyltransferase